MKGFLKSHRLPAAAIFVAVSAGSAICTLRDICAQDDASSLPTKSEALDTPSPSADFNALLGRREVWPRTAILTRAAEFPAVMNGKVVGKIQVPAGSEIRVRALKPGGVEAEFRGAVTLLSADQTDVMERSAASLAGPPPPPTTPSPERVAPAPASLPSPSQPAATPAVGLSSAEMLRRLGIEVVRSRRRRVEGGDFDDKIDSISGRVKLVNQDTKHAMQGWRGKIVVLTESVLVSGVYKVLIMEDFDLDIAPRATFERETREVESGFDTTYAKWGYKYAGWILALDDPEGKRVLVKATNPNWEKSDRIDALQVDKTYDRELKERVSPEERFSR